MVQQRNETATDMIQSSEDGSYLVDLSNGILRITFNRPEQGNAVPNGAVPGVARLFCAAQDNHAVRCMLIGANGKVFSTGGDLAAFAKTLEQDAAAREADFTERLPVSSKPLSRSTGRSWHGYAARRQRPECCTCLLPTTPLATTAPASCLHISAFVSAR